MKLTPWVVRHSTPDAQLGVVRALRYDYKMRQNRYEYIETIIRWIPGKFGVALRATLLGSFFRQFGSNVVLWPGSRFRFPYRIRIGHNVAVSYDCILQGGGGISIGNNTLLGPGVKVWSVNHLFKDTARPINVQGYEGRPVAIGNDCWIGSDSFIKPGAVLPTGCVVLPGTILGKMRIPEYSVVAGNPAEVLGPRNRVGAMLGWGAVEK